MFGDYRFQLWPSVLLRSGRLKTLVLLYCLLLLFWVLVPRRPADVQQDGGSRAADDAQVQQKLSELKGKMVALDKEVDQQRAAGNILMENVNSLAAGKGGRGTRDRNQEATAGLIQSYEAVIPVLVMACNRVTVKDAVDLIIQYRGDSDEAKAKFPIIISQDCGDSKTADVIRTYGADVIFIQQPNLTEPVVEPKLKKFTGYYKIARHYAFALNHVLTTLNHDQVIIVEDDLKISPDFFNYFEATLPLLKRDNSLWCVSAWNDNGREVTIDRTRNDLLYRSDFFGGLGWMITKELWIQELMTKWPQGFWDDWMRQPGQRKGRACLRPEVSRTITFGKIGVSNGMFYEHYLKHIVLNEVPFDFKAADLTYLTRNVYDKEMDRTLTTLPVVPIKDLRGVLTRSIQLDKEQQQASFKIMYKTEAEFKRAAKIIGLMEDFKSGVPRTAYRGVVTAFNHKFRIYLSPGLNWAGYKA